MQRVVPQAFQENGERQDVRCLPRGEATRALRGIEFGAQRLREAPVRRQHDGARLLALREQREEVATGERREGHATESNAARARHASLPGGYFFAGGGTTMRSSDFTLLTAEMSRMRSTARTTTSKPDAGIAR